MTVRTITFLKTVAFAPGQAPGAITPDPDMADLLDTIQALTTAEISSSVKTANYTLALVDAQTVVEVNATTGISITVPPGVFTIGTVIEVHQYGTGQVTLVAGAGVTLRTPSSLTTRAQYSTLSLRLRATNEWIVGGDMT
jgi:hypothetical protein